MGIDLLDMVFRIEQRFGVKISSGDFAGVTTVADVAALVIRLSAPPAGLPGPRAVFRGMQRIVAESSGRGARSVRPGMRFDSMVISERCRVWEALRAAYPRLPKGEPTRWPKRKKHAAWHWVIWLTTAGMVAAAWMTSERQDALGNAILAGLITPLAVLSVVWLTTERESGWRPPTHVATVRDAVALLARDLRGTSLSAGEVLIWQQTVIEGVREIVIEALAVNADEVTLDAELARDLGAT